MSLEALVLFVFYEMIGEDLVLVYLFYLKIKV
jgi:hypothetical protein